jgi:hypothetical protein
MADKTKDELMEDIGDIQGSLEVLLSELSNGGPFKNVRECLLYACLNVEEASDYLNDLVSD